MPDRPHTLDLHFQEQEHTIAAYLIPHDKGAALVESGPGSTFPMLQAQLAEHGLTPADISHVLLTHVHLDHAGAAGHLAEHGATVYVHHRGAPHLANPERLWKSASRIYGDDMEQLWGSMRPVPQDQIEALEDEDTVSLGAADAYAAETPGHASHHMSYVIDEVCFTGDVGGVRMPYETYIELPLAPPEIHLDHWRESVSRLRRTANQREVSYLAPTHFGLYEDVDPHLDRLDRQIDEAEDWAERVLPTVLDDDSDLEDATVSWLRGLAAAHGVDEETWTLYETANPSWMAALGLKRFWHTHREGDNAAFD